VHGLLIVDKPSGPTSHDVVQRARRALATRDVGHAGTLDPLASGVLVLAVGEGTKLLRYLTLDDKRYEVAIVLGAETDTLDAQGRVTETAPVPALSDAQVARALATFVGEQAQVPPAYSAIKRDGVRAHARARRGEAVDMAPRAVVAHVLGLEARKPHELRVSVHCGKGFYVRSLARDLARALGTRGHVGALRRTQSGPFRVADGVGFELVQRAAAGDAAAKVALGAALIPVERGLPDVPQLRLDETGVQHARAGRAIPVSHVLASSGQGAAGELPAPGTEPVLLLDAKMHAVALARMEDAALLRVVRGFTALDA
jgi:tRNA pseudouridine55 synthase